MIRIAASNLAASGYPIAEITTLEVLIDPENTKILDFCIKIGPSIYNQAIADAQSYFQVKTSDLGGARYEAEFDFWKK
jgi:uncharacterized protein (DUF2164 family)